MEHISLSSDHAEWTESDRPAKKQRQHKLRSHGVTCRPLPKRSMTEKRGTGARKGLCNLPARQRSHGPNFQSRMVSPRETCDSGSAYTNKKRIIASIRSR